MNSKNIEITVFISIMFIASVLIFFRNSIKRKNKNAYYITMVIIALIEGFIIVHFFFCYQIGFPASVMQDNNTDLTLSASDWLGFLGGYLGFAGSLVMAYLVYRQSEAINKLTVSEYLPSASLVIQKCAKSIDYNDFLGERILQPITDNSTEKYYTFRCRRADESDVEHETFDILIFTEIVNNSKLPISRLSFSRIEIEGTEDNEPLIFYNCGEKWDPADKKTVIYSGKKLKRCFMIENIPCNIDMSWMTIIFTHGENQILPLEVLIQKTKGELINFYSISQ